MKILILGCGNIGSVAARDITKSLGSIKVVVADKNVKRAKEVSQEISGSNVSWTHLDATNYNEMVNAMKDIDLVMGFLPGKLGYRLAEASITAEKDLVDVSYMPNNPLTLDKRAAESGVTIIPDCGLAPGISNILVGHAIKKFDHVQSIHIMVGGIPEKPIPPLGYNITWSPVNLIDEYTRKAKIIEKGRMVWVDALSGLEEVEFPNVGRLEAFYTDGLRTLLHTVKNVESMWEKTLRYKGHAEKIKLLKALGFFDEKQIDVEGVSLSPRKLTVKLFKEKLWKPEIRDIVVMKVEVSGLKNGKQVRYIYYLFDRYDMKRKITAMARTTAYPASIIGQFILRKAIKEKGVVPPERLGMNDRFFQMFINELEKRGIKIIEEKVVD